MTVKELIIILNSYENDKKVVFETPEGDKIEDIVFGNGSDGEIVISEF